MSGKIQPAQVTAGHIRERMAGTRMPTDPLAVVMPPGSRAWPEELRRKMCENLKPAGVLIPILEHPDGLSVLLTQRSADLKIHAGQVSFKAMRRRAAEHPLEEVGEKLRAMMPWIAEGRLVDKSKN